MAILNRLNMHFSAFLRTSTVLQTVEPKRVFHLPNYNIYSVIRNAVFLFLKSHKHRKRGVGGAGGSAPPNNLRVLRVGGQHTLWPPIIHPHFPSISI